LKEKAEEQKNKAKRGAEDLKEKADDTREQQKRDSQSATNKAKRGAEKGKEKAESASNKAKEKSSSAIRIPIHHCLHLSHLIISFVKYFITPPYISVSIYRSSLRRITWTRIILFMIN